MRLEGRIPIGAKNAGQVTEKLAQLGAALMVRVLRDPSAFPPVAQPEDGVTYAEKIRKDEALLDLSAYAARVVRQVAAFAPVPGAFFAHAGERVKVLAAEAVDGDAPAGTVLDDALTIACGNGAIRPVRVQRAGRGVMSVAELLRGFAIPAGTRL